MIKKQFFSLLCLSLSLTLSTVQQAHAEFVTYSDRGTFNANSTGLTTIGFEDTAPPSGYKVYGSSAEFSGVKFDGNILFTVDSAYDPQYYDYGSGDVLLQEYAGELTTVTLPANVTAVGFDYMSWAMAATVFQVPFSLLLMARPSLE